MKSKIVALKKNEDFKSLLKGRKISNKYFVMFYKKLLKKNSNKFNVSIVTKKLLLRNLFAIFNPFDTLSSPNNIIYKSTGCTTVSLFKTSNKRSKPAANPMAGTTALESTFFVFSLIIGTSSYT